MAVTPLMSVLPVSAAVVSTVVAAVSAAPIEMLSRYVESYVDFIQNLPHDDDDEVYSAFFHPTASPVATPHAFVEILSKLPDGSRLSGSS